MKLGEIKLEALALIYPGAELMCDADNDTSLREKLRELANDSNYSDLLSAMPGAINRCFAELEGRSLVPRKSCELDTSKGKRLGNKIVFDTSLLESYLKTEKVLHYNDFCDIHEVDFNFLSENEILLDGRDGKFVLIYTPVVKRISQISDDASVIKLPEHLCALIPYFIKSELIRAENEKEAAIARNIFEEMISALSIRENGVQTKVESVYEVPL